MYHLNDPNHGWDIGGCTYSIHRVCSRWGDDLLVNLENLNNIKMIENLILNYFGDKCHHLPI